MRHVAMSVPCCDSVNFQASQTTLLTHAHCTLLCQVEPLDIGNFYHPAKALWDAADKHAGNRHYLEARVCAVCVCARACMWCMCDKLGLHVRMRSSKTSIMCMLVVPNCAPHAYAPHDPSCAAHTHI